MDTSIFIGTWWSLVPPLLAIILALVTKEVVQFPVYWSGGRSTVIYRISSVECIQCPVFDYERQHESEYSDFDVLLGMIIVLMSKSGGSAAYGRWAGSKIRSKKSAMLATTGLGMLILWMIISIV